MNVPRTIYMRIVCRFRSEGKIMRHVDLSPRIRLSFKSLVSLRESSANVVCSVLVHHSTNFLFPSCSLDFPHWMRHPWSRSVLSSHSVVSICGVCIGWIFLWKNRWHLSTVISIRDRDRFDLYIRRVPIVIYPSLSLFFDHFFPFKGYIRKQVTGEVNGCWQMCDWLYGDKTGEAKIRVATSSGGKDTMTWGICDTTIRAHCRWTNVESEHL